MEIVLIDTAAHAIQSTPWWGSAVLAGLFVLAGAVAGGALTFLNGWLAQSRANRREDRLRWVRDMREVSADFAAGCHDLEDAALLLHNARIRDRDAISESHRNELWGRIVNAQHVLVRSSSIISLIAPDEIADQAHEVLARANEVAQNCETTEFDYSEIQIEYSEACADFIMLTREHLGVDLAELR